MKKQVWTVWILLGLALSVRAQPPEPVVSEKLLYLSSKIQELGDYRQTCELINQAARAGYNGVAFTYSLSLLSPNCSPAYASKIRAVRDACRRARLNCIACVMPVGYANGILANDPNLAEGLPVIDAPFVVRNNTVTPDDRSIQLLNPGFEDFSENVPQGWKLAGRPGKTIFIDTSVKSQGKASLRIQNMNAQNGKTVYAAVDQSFKVQPFRYYHVSLAVKTRNYDPPKDPMIKVKGDGRTWLNYYRPPVSPTQHWKTIHITFNSLEFTNVTLQLSASSNKNGTSGTLWLDDVRTEPAGLVNVVRRSGTPLRMTSEDGKIEYVEGKDFQNAMDRRLGNFPEKGSFSAWHRPPIITLPPTSRLRDGQQVRLSYYHTPIIGSSQVMCCMSEPKVYEILDNHIKRVKNELSPDGYFLQHDEIRVQGYDASCAARGMTPGQILADNIARCVRIIQKYDPNKPIYVWSDMFDPYHNARKIKRSYLVKGEGPWHESWKGLPAEVIIVNWWIRNPDRRKTMEFFSNRGHRQILAGYYDSDPWLITAWLRDGTGIPGINGVMYTTWKKDYRHMVDFLRYAEEKSPPKP